MHISLTGYDSKTHAKRQISANSSLGGSIAVDIYSYLRLGLSYSEREESTYGRQEYRDASGSLLLPKFENTVTISQYSLDLTVVLYNGQLVTPYVFGGAAKKSYKYSLFHEYDNLGEPIVVKVQPKEWVWNAGIGLQMLLSTRLSLKLSYSFSEGQKTDSKGNVGTALDTYLQYGLSYKL